MTARVTLQVGYGPFWFTFWLFKRKTRQVDLVSSWTVLSPPLARIISGRFWVGQKLSMARKRTHPPTTPLSKDSHKNIK